MDPCALLPEALFADGSIDQDFLSIAVSHTISPVTDEATVVACDIRIHSHHFGAIGTVVIDEDPRTLLVVLVKLSQECGCRGDVDSLAPSKTVLVEFANVGRNGSLALVPLRVCHLAFYHFPAVVQTLENSPIGKPRNSEAVLEAILTGGC